MTKYHTHFVVDWSKQKNDGSTGIPSESPSFVLDQSVKDVIRRMPTYYATGSDDVEGLTVNYLTGHNTRSSTGDGAVENSWIFSLDDVRLEEGASKDSTDSDGGVIKRFPLAYYVSGSRQTVIDTSAAGGSALRSWTAASGAFNDSLEGLCDFGFNKMTTLFFGGHDGYDLSLIHI